MLTEGEVRDTLFILLSGLVKLTYSTFNGDEWVKGFIVDQGVFGPNRDEAVAESQFGAVALENSCVVELPASWVRLQVATTPKLAQAADQFHNWMVNRKLEREKQLLCLSAEDRYRAFLLKQPHLARRLPQGDLARYLRVTPVAFSRIKKRVGSSAEPTRVTL